MFGHIWFLVLVHPPGRTLVMRTIASTSQSIDPVCEYGYEQVEVPANVWPNYQNTESCNAVYFLKSSGLCTKALVKLGPVEDTGLRIAWASSVYKDQYAAAGHAAHAWYAVNRKHGWIIDSSGLPKSFSHH